MERVSFGDKVAAVGGVLGLFLGFSFLTLFDIILGVFNLIKLLTRKVKSIIQFN